MAIVQISKIQLRTGLSTELPDSLDEGEIGFASNTGELFIGAPALQNISYRAIGTGSSNNGIYPYRNIKILTELDATHTVSGDIFTIGPLGEYAIAGQTSAPLFTCDVPASNIFIDFSIEESINESFKGSIAMTGSMNIVRFDDSIGAIVKIYDYMILDDNLVHPYPNTLTLQSLSWTATITTGSDGTIYMTLNYNNTTSRQFNFRILSSSWSPMFEIYEALDHSLLSRLDNSPYASQTWISTDFQNISLTGSVTGYAQVTTLASGFLAITIPTTLVPQSGLSAGTYNTVTVNNDGIVTSGSNNSYIGSSSTFTLTGPDVFGSGGSGNISTTLNNTVMTAGTYTRVVVNSKGLVVNDTLGGNLTGAGDSTTIMSSITSNVYINDSSDVWILTVTSSTTIDFSQVSTFNSTTRTKTIVLIGNGTNYTITWNNVIWDMGVNQLYNSGSNKRTIYSFMKFPITSDSNVYGGRAVYQP